MAKGRKPKPVEVKRREGNPGKRALPDVVLVGGRGEPDKPPGLSGVADALWDLEVPKMAHAGLLDRIDGPMLGQYFEAWAVCIGAARELYGDENSSDFLTGPVIWQPNDSSGEMTPKKHPGVTALKDGQTMMRQIATEFGFTPSSRASLGYSGLVGASPAETDGEIGESPRLRVVDGGAAN